jgi:hypothetical protein
MARGCENINELSGSIKYGEFIDELRDYQIFCCMQIAS